ncbi:gamma-glutamylcyclotransferase family protein [Pseudoalteromonas sp. GB56]
MHKLFSYGTLQLPKVQLETFGRLLEGHKDTLLGYVLNEVKITDADVIKTSGKEIHPILTYSGNCQDRVEGMVFYITDEELRQSDAYEVDEYTRVMAEFLSKNHAWVYVCAQTESRRNTT